ncbi:MAG: hypothetical protein H6P95_2938 [Candidatus Aminicenantes bacterium]|nr:hypothetical protein [Candidatus Aminicenantes bacterium]
MNGRAMWAQWAPTTGRESRDEAFGRLLRGQEKLERPGRRAEEAIGQAGGNDDGHPLFEVDAAAARLDPALAAEDEQEDLFARVRVAPRGDAGRELGPAIGLEEPQDSALLPGSERIAAGQDIPLGEPAVRLEGRRTPPVIDIEGNVRIDVRPAPVGRRVFPVGGAGPGGRPLRAARRDGEDGGEGRQGEPQSLFFVHGGDDRWVLAQGGETIK